MPQHEQKLRAWVLLGLWVSGFWITFVLWLAALILPPVPGDPSLAPVFGGTFVVCFFCSGVQLCEVLRLNKRAG